MKSINSLHTVKRGFVSWLLLCLLFLAGAQYCQAGQLALMLQQSPVDGGSVEPGTGVHKIDRDTNVTLRAVPQPGYQFVCWLGEVAEPTASVTTAYIDSPKIIIAVFERVQYDSMAAADALFSRPGGGLLRSAGDIVAQGGGGGGGKRPHKYYPPSYPDQDEDDDILVPDEGDELPVPDVPEPATIMLVGLGAIFTLRRRTAARNVQPD